MQRFGIAIGIISLLIGTRGLAQDTAEKGSIYGALAGANPVRISPEPVLVTGLNNPILDLDGTWRFSSIPTLDFTQATPEPSGSLGSAIEVPGQWLQQGFTVKKGEIGLYQRSYTVPPDWAGKRVKLRCDAVYSDALIWINGKSVGRHLGGFTPFEFDVTDAVQPGQISTITLAVKSGGEADQLASGIKYACHDLGGITRKIRLMAMPAINVASIHVTTTFDRAFKNATMEVTARLANEGTTISKESHLDLALSDPQGGNVPLNPMTTELPPLHPGEILEKTLSLPVEQPQKWDPDHPRLYLLKATIQSGAALETVSTRVGFRQVEVRGNRMFVNGEVVKLRGVCRHETDPLRGRSVPSATEREDVEIFAHANVNFIRTSHYPPTEEFLDACDELGMFVESEAPICWSKGDSSSLPLILNETREMVESNRNHPSVIIWSIANESKWGPVFDQAARTIRDLDPSRPRIFSFGESDLISWHYPGNNIMARDDADASMPAAPNWGRNRPLLSTSNDAIKPVLCDEYCHLNAYNRREQTADPGLRDAWGEGFAATWEEMQSHPGCLGGALWAGIDDTFFLPDNTTVGYGTWGVIDGWRRPKPEYWHVTKVYSPVGILDTKVSPPIRLTVENRSNFTNLKEMHFNWTLGKKSGAAMTEARPGAKGTLEIPGGVAGQDLEIQVIGPRGFLVDAYRFTLGGESLATPAPLRSPGPVKVTQDAQAICITGDKFNYVIDSLTGQLRTASASGHDLPLSGPCLTLVPHDREGGGIQMSGKESTFAPLWGLLTNWKASSVVATPTQKGVVVHVIGSYAEAAGSYDLTIDATGRLTASWNFTVKDVCNPRQIGVTFLLPKSCQTLSWHRRGQWSFYPEDHIGRPAGTAAAFPNHPMSGLTGPHLHPTWPWSEDADPYGSNDFRSTKFNILEATLADTSGTGLRAVAAADRHAHAWIDGDHAFFMIADYANDGSEGFFQPTRAMLDHKIAAGVTVTGSAQIEVTQQL